MVQRKVMLSRCLWLRTVGSEPVACSCNWTIFVGNTTLLHLELPSVLAAAYYNSVAPSGVIGQQPMSIMHIPGAVWLTGQWRPKTPPSSSFNSGYRLMLHVYIRGALLPGLPVRIKPLVLLHCSSSRHSYFSIPPAPIKHLSIHSHVGRNIQ